MTNYLNPKNMTKVTNDEMRDMIDYHIVYSDEKNQYPNVWINMIYLDENYSHIREYWNQDKFSLFKGLSLPYRI